MPRIHATAFVVPVLVDAGQPARAREAIDEVLADWRPGHYRGRLLALRAWLRHGSGDAGAWDDLRAAWQESGDQVKHLLRREWPRLERVLWDALAESVIEPEDAVAAAQAAFPGGEALLPFTEHPVPAVRRAAIPAAAASGRPEVPDRLERLGADEDPATAAAARAALQRVTRTAPPLRFRALGRFEVRRGTWELDDAAWERPMAARVVRYLLVHRGTPVTADQLFETFWPDKSPSAARHGLAVALSRARAALDGPGEGESVIDSRRHIYRLALRDEDEVDVDAFEAAADAGLRAQGSERRALLEQAAARWGGEPLPEDRYEAWSFAWRERLLDRRIEVLSALMAARQQQGDLPGAVQVARELVAADPLDESAHRALMVLYARAGRRGHALRQYLECRRSLVDELGVEPAAATAALQARILAGEPV